MAIAVKRGFGGGGGSKPKRIYLIQNGEVLVPYRPVQNTITIGKSGNYATITGTYNVSSTIEFETTGIDTAKYTRLVCVARINTTQYGANCGITLSIGGGTMAPNQTTDQTYAVSVVTKVPDEKVQLYMYSNGHITYIKDLYFEDEGSGQKLTYVDYGTVGNTTAGTGSYNMRTYEQSNALPKLSDRYYEFTCYHTSWMSDYLKIQFKDANGNVIESADKTFPAPATAGNKYNERYTQKGTIPEGTTAVNIWYQTAYNESYNKNCYLKTSYNPIL